MDNPVMIIVKVNHLLVSACACSREPWPLIIRTLDSGCCNFLIFRTKGIIFLSFIFFVFMKKRASRTKIYFSFRAHIKCIQILLFKTLLLCVSMRTLYVIGMYNHTGKTFAIYLYRNQLTLKNNVYSLINCELMLIMFTSDNIHVRQNLHLHVLRLT